MKKRGFRYVIVGLVFGVSVGLGVRAIEGYLSRTLIGILSDEVKGSCNCRLDYDEVSVSLVTMRAVAKGARLVAFDQNQSRVAMSVPTIRASFSLKNIRSKEVLLTELRLEDVVVDGVGPDTPTYLFIDHLSEPLPPERRLADRWKLKLMRLTVARGSFQEPFGKTWLRGHDVSMDMNRNVEDDFVMTTSAPQLKLDLPSGRSLAIGGVRGELFLEDSFIDFRKISYKYVTSWAEAKALSWSSARHSLEGGLTFDLEGSSFTDAFGPASVSGSLVGMGIVQGRLARPEFVGHLKNTTPMVVGTTADPIFTLTSIQGDWKAKLDESGAFVGTFNSLTAEGPQCSVALESPVEVRINSLRGKAHLKFDELKTNDAVFRGVDLMVDLGGTPVDFEPKISGTISQIEAQGAILNEVGVAADVSGDKLTTRLTAAGDSVADLSFDLKNGGSLQRGTFSVNMLKIPDQSPEVILTARGTIDPSTKNNLGVAIFGTGELEVPRLNTVLPTAFSLQETGTVTFGSIEKNPLSGTLVYDPATHRAKLEATANASQIPATEKMCAQLNGSLTYEFFDRAILSGNGSLTLERAALGCPTPLITLPNNSRLVITDGALQLGELIATTETGILNISGEISPHTGLNVKARGDVDLPTIAGFFPTLDDLRGKATVLLSLSGPFSAPMIRGVGDITHGEVAIESANFGARNIFGTINFQDDRARLNMTGIVNDGTATIEGVIYPFEITKSEVTARVERMQLEPLTETYLVVSADLTLRQDSTGRSTLTGTITVPEAELHRNISLGHIVRTLAENIFRHALPNKESDPLPEINLDLKFTAPRGAYVVTNFAGVELRADFSIRGTLPNPQIEGSVETLGGWFGLKNRQFEISSGSLRFRADRPEPELNISGETALTGRGGELISVAVRVSGALSNPKVSFSSSSGLPERELVALLTQGGSNLLQSRRSAAGRESDAAALSVVNGFTALGFNRLFSSLTKIDSISVEPTYNPTTGHVEPSVVATKYLSDTSRLIGETFLGSGGGRVRALYDLSPRLIAAASLESEQDKTTNPIGFDLAYTVLARKRPTTNVTFENRSAFSEQDLRGALKISEFLPVTAPELTNLKERLERYYIQHGFFEVSSEIACKETCREITITLNEGRRGMVTEVKLGGDDIVNIISPATLKTLKTLPPQIPASRDFGRSMRDQLTRLLRNEGYIGSRVDESYENLPAGVDKNLLLTVQLGDPVTFTFRGNSIFSDRQLLDTINLFERRQPFGHNTINILLQNIERSYRASGYLYATISLVSTDQPLTNSRVRRNFVITIDEGPRVPVATVNLIDSPVTEDELRTVLGRDDPSLVNRIFKPEYAVAEEIERNQEILQAAFVELGFPVAALTGRIATVKSSTQVQIEYLVNAGQRVVATECSVTGLPTEVPGPVLGSGPYSVPHINHILDTVRATLRDHGYFNAEVVADLSADFEVATISVTPNTGTMITSIEISGLEHVSETLVRETFGIAIGQRWSESALASGSDRLLRLGLFDRALVEPADGAWDEVSEAVKITVTETTRQLLDVGLGLNSEYGVHVFGEGVDRSVFNDGRSIGLRVDTYYDRAAADISRGTANLRYADPNFLIPDLSLTEDLRFQRFEQSTEPFDLDRWSLGSYLHLGLDEQETFSFGHTILQYQLDNVEPGAIIGPFDSGSVNIGYLSTTYSLDRRDNPLTPRRGYTLTLDTQFAAPFFGSEADFGALGARGSFIIPLPNLSWVIAMHHEVREAWAFGSTDEVPLSERYFLGGRTTVRGFRENSIGERGADGAIIGGDRSYAGAIELQYFFVDAAQVHFFYDAGSINLRSRGGLFDDLRTSTGIGIRYVSPIGPIGFDLGHPLDEKAGEPSVRLHFTVGTSF